MKIFVFTLFLYFSFFAACGIYAGNSTLISNYPAPSGAYNKVVIQTQSTVDCSTTSNNAGLLFFNTATNTLQLCAKVNGQTVAILAGETCFNRFCSSGPSCFDPAATACPSGYTQAKNNGPALIDNFTTASGYTVYSTVCCNTNSSVHP